MGAWIGRQLEIGLVAGLCEQRDIVARRHQVCEQRDRPWTREWVQGRLTFSLIRNDSQSLPPFALLGIFVTFVVGSFPVPSTQAP